MRIAFVGVGKMGLPMAGHLARAGHPLRAFDPDPARRDAAAAAGLEVAADLPAALAGAGLAFSSLPHDEALLEVAGALAAAGFEGIWVDTSTVSPQASARAAATACAGGARHVRMTVSGNNHMAEAAQLTLIGSGDADAWREVEPLLPRLGPTRFWVGDGEQARLMKLVVNLMIAVTSGMLAEALTLGRKGGLAWDDMWQVLTASAVASPIVRAKSVQLGARDFTPTFTVPQMNKDIDLVLGAGRALGVPLALTAQVREQMTAAIAQGDAGLDYAAVIRVLERASGLDTENP
jgi:3-hydroxyisobutyrate dehydrogenase